MAKQKLEQEFVTTGADQAAADVERVAKSTDKVTDADKQSAKATEDATVKKENLLNVLNKIHPALGGLADGLINAAELSGALAVKDINLAGAKELLTKATIKYKNALLLLGAGGAAIGAVLLLIATVKKLREEWEKAHEAQLKFLETQATIEGKTQDIREELTKRLIETKPTFTREELEKQVTETRRLITAGVEPSRALDIASGRTPPLTSKQEERTREFFGPRAQRDREREQFEAFDVGAESGILGRKGVRPSGGDERAILGLIEREFGLSGDEAKKFLQEMRERLARRRGDIDDDSFFSGRNRRGEAERERDRQLDRLLISIGGAEELRSARRTGGGAPIRIPGAEAWENAAEAMRRGTGHYERATRNQEEATAGLAAEGHRRKNKETRQSRPPVVTGNK